MKSNVMMILRDCTKKLLGYVCMCALIAVLFLFITAPVAAENEVNHDTASIMTEDAKLPDGYTHFGPGEWASDTEWTGFVVDSRGVSGISGNSKECYIYKMTIYGIGNSRTYTVVPVFEMDGRPSTIPYDGIAFG